MSVYVPDEETRLLEDQQPSQKGLHDLTIGSELVKLAVNTFPISLSFALQNVVQAFCILMAGRLGPFELDVASYGFMFAACTGSMVAIGGATALDTLCGQAITRENTQDPKALSNYLHQSFVALLAIFALLIAPLWVWSGPLFIALGQEHDFALGTGKFLIFTIPSGVLQVVVECLKKFLQVQGESNAVGWANLIASVLGMFLAYILVTLSNLGLVSVIIAFAVYQLANLILIALHIGYLSTAKLSLRPSMNNVLAGLPRFFGLAITGILTTATEWWSFEILAMMAARLDSKSIGAQSILMSSDLIFTTGPLGLGVAVTHSIGKYLGAGLADHARYAIRLPYLFALLLGSLEFIVIMAVRHSYGYLFTNVEEIVDITAQVLPLMAGFQVLDLGNGAAVGVLRGAGKNHLPGFCNIVAYYGVGLTTAWYLCFQLDYGLFGLWAGIITGSGVLLIIQTLCIYFIRWDDLAEEISRLETRD